MARRAAKTALTGCRLPDRRDRERPDLQRPEVGGDQDQRARNGEASDAKLHRQLASISTRMDLSLRGKQDGDLLHPLGSGRGAVHQMNVAVLGANSPGSGSEPEFELTLQAEAETYSAANSSTATGATSTTGSATASKRAYPLPAELPTQMGPNGLRFDFNDGCRIVLEEAEHPWRVRLSDLDTGNILFETGAENRSRQQHQALLRPLPHRGVAERRERICS